MRPAEILQEIRRGRVEGADVNAAMLEGSHDPIERTWGAAVRMALHMADAARFPASVRVDELGGAAVDDAHRQARLTLGGLVLRHAYACFDRERADRWLEALAADRAHICSPAFEVAAHAADVDAGRASECEYATLASFARREGDAATVIDLVVARALDAEAEGDLGTVLTTARRGSRMARAEGLPQQEYFANIVLARARRLVGHPHLAVRILGALKRIASRSWQSWIGWELRLANANKDGVDKEGQEDGGENDADEHDASLVLDEVLIAAHAGCAEDFGAASERLNALAQPSRRHASDVSPLLTALDPRVDVGDAPLELRPWLCGSVSSPPRGLQGVGAGSGEPGDIKAAVVFVAAHPQRGARRFLGPGIGLRADWARLAQSQRRQGRMDTAVAVLALAGPSGLPITELFERVYEFAYDPDIHDGALRKLLARVHDWLGPLGEVVADGDTRSLRLREPLVVADPRSVPPVDVRLLGVVATRGAASAKDAARRLQIPLRTAQAALQDLMKDGTVERVRRGNIVEYRLEDTTFSEPTQR